MVFIRGLRVGAAVHAGRRPENVAGRETADRDGAYARPVGRGTRRSHAARPGQAPVCVPGADAPGSAGGMDPAAASRSWSRRCISATNASRSPQWPRGPPAPGPPVPGPPAELSIQARRPMKPPWPHGTRPRPKAPNVTPSTIRARMKRKKRPNRTPKIPKPHGPPPTTTTEPADAAEAAPWLTPAWYARAAMPAPRRRTRTPPRSPKRVRMMWCSTVHEDRSWTRPVDGQDDAPAMCAGCVQAMRIVCVSRRTAGHRRRSVASRRRARARVAGPGRVGPVHSTEAPRVAAGASRGSRRREDADVHGTPDAARRQRAHLSRLLRAHQRAALDLEGRAGERGLRVLEHRPARLPGRATGLRRDRLRPAGPDLPARPVRRLQGDPTAHAGRPARPVPEGPRGGRGAAPPGLRDGGLRGGRRHRHAHTRGRG